MSFNHMTEIKEEDDGSAMEETLIDQCSSSIPSLKRDSLHSGGGGGDAIRTKEHIQIGYDYSTSQARSPNDDSQHILQQ